MDNKNKSKWFLKKSTFTQFMFIILAGRRLKILAYWTKKEILLVIRKKLVVVDNLKRNMIY